MSTAIIPSRYGSSRFEGKPLALVHGKPMIQRVYEQAIKAAAVERVVVATDDQRIARAVERFGGEVVMTGSDLRSGSDRVAEAAGILGLDSNEIVVNIQGDQPAFAPECIDELVAPLLRDPAIDMSTLAYRITDPRELTDPKDVKVTMDVHGFALYFSRARIPFPRDNDMTSADTYKHLGFYAYPLAFLKMMAAFPTGVLEQTEKLEQLRVLENGHKIKVVITRHDSPEVDLPEDIGRVETFLGRA